MFRAILVVMALTCATQVATAQPIPDFSMITPEVTQSEPTETSTVAVEEQVNEPEPEPEPVEKKPIEAVDKSQPVSRCLASKIRYVESASRKLRRAFGSKGYKMKPVGLPSAIVVESVEGDGSLTFQAYLTEDASVAGVVSEEAKEGYVVANTSRGYLITAIKWSGCRPGKTYVAYPSVGDKNVALEPFKYWGFRVLWALPKTLGQKDASQSLAEVIKRAR